MGWSDDYLEHHGILGQKWGVRRFQNPDGTLKPAGKNRYGNTEDKLKELNKKYNSKFGKLSEKSEAYREKQVKKKTGLSIADARAEMIKAHKSGDSKREKELSDALSRASKKQRDKFDKKIRNLQEEAAQEEQVIKGERRLTDKQKKMIIAGAAVLGTALAAYGGYKLYQLNKQAKEGLSGEYNNMAKKSFFNANDYAAKAQKFHMEGNFGKERYGADNLGVQAAKIGEEYFNNQSKLTNDLGKQLQAKANSKDFSVKEKVDYLKTKNDASRPQKQLEKAQQQFNAQASANKLASEASSLARSVTMTGPMKTSSKPAQNNTAKVNRTPVSYTPVNRTQINRTPIKGSKTFIDASKANDDLVQELLKKNTLRF